MDRQQWHISDTHFFSKDLLSVECRPFSSVKEMNEKIIENWNSVVKPSDRVIHHGDVASEFCSVEQLKELISKLEGQHTLILGNHDSFLSVKDWIKIGFDEVFRFPIIMNKFFICSHDFCYLEPNSCYCNLHGHIHSMQFDDHIHFHNVSVEHINYTPINFEAIVERIRKEQAKD
jgi:calcineurin-like phosphoesterase family protein